MTSAPDDWAPPPIRPALPPDEVHVWRIDLALPVAAVRSLLERLSAEDVARAERFHFEDDRRRFAVAHAALRSILARYAGVDPVALTIGVGDAGKPFLTTAGKPSPPRFNLSHSRDLGLVAVSREREVGVDLESLGRAGDVEAIASRYFSAAERAALGRLPGADRPRALLRAWVAKEAYLKACGDGLSRRLEDFDVSVDDGEDVRLVQVRDHPDDESRWTLRWLRPHPDFAAAVAVEGDGWRLVRWSWRG